MTRRNVLLTIGAAALAIAIAVPVAFSHGPRGGDGPRDGKRGEHFERLAEKLGLDAKQAAAFKTLKEGQLAGAQALTQQIRTKHEQVEALWLAPQPDKAKILQAQREIVALQGQLAESRVEFMFKVRGVLTPAQFKTFIEMGKEHGFHGRHGKGRFHGGRGGPDAPDESDSPETEQ